MKKGLLSILAVALTIVSCQNYDDQFAELTGLVDKLSTDVKGLSTVKGDLSSLTTLVTNLGTSIAAIPDPTSEITNIASGLASATTKINAIKVILDSGLATASDIVSITQTISGIQTGINTLLTKNATLVVDVTINNATTLAAAKELILTGPTSPAKYILTGNVNVDFTNLSDTQQGESNVLTKKIISVSGSVTTSGTVSGRAIDITGLSAVLGSYNINGQARASDTAITNIGANLSVSGRLGILDFSNLVKVTGVVSISDAASVTMLDFRNVVGTSADIRSGLLAATPIAGVTVFANATEVHTGSLLVKTLGAAKATAIAIGQPTNAAADNLAITAPKAVVVNINGLVTSLGTVSIAASNTAVVHIDNMTSVKELDIITNIVGQLWIDKLAIMPTNGASVNTIWAKVVSARLLADISGATNFKGTTTLDAPVLDAITGAFALTLPALEPVNLPLLDLGAGTMVTTATKITIANSNDADFAKFLTATNVDVTLTGQKVAVVLAASAQTVTKLSVTSGGLNAATGSSYNFTAAAANIVALTTLTVNGFHTVSVGTNGTSNGTLTSLTTGGEMASFSIIDLDELVTLNTLHTPMEWLVAPNAARQTVNISLCAKLTKVDLTTVDQLMTASIIGNPLLTVITAPAVGNALKYNAVINFTIGGATAAATSNKLSATHAQPVVGGTLEEIKQPSLRTWLDYVTQMVDLQKVKIADGTLPANAYAGYSAAIDGTADATAYGVYALDYDKNADGTTNELASGATGSTVVNRISSEHELVMIDNNLLNP